MMGIPLIPSPTLKSTTTSLTVTSRIHSPEKMRTNLKKIAAPQTYKNLRTRTTTGHPLFSRTIYALLVNLIYSHLSKMGKVAIIRDIGAVTYVWHGSAHTCPCLSLVNHSLEAFLYFLYTGEINFAPLSSDLRGEQPAQTRAGDWSTGRIPSSSAKSIYRLADKVTGLYFVLTYPAHRFKYDIPTLKEHAKAHICNNLEHCDILEEIFSSFARL